MKRDNIEVIGGFLMILLLPYIAVYERVFRVYERDWRGYPRYITAGVLGCVAWLSFGVQLIVLGLIACLVGLL